MNFLVVIFICGNLGVVEREYVQIQPAKITAIETKEFSPAFQVSLLHLFTNAVSGMG
jgi:hypothetical protein